MDERTVVTSSQGQYSLYPNFLIRWVEGPFGTWEGVGHYWFNKEKRHPREWKILVGAASPVGHIWAMFEPCNGGAWCSARISADEVTVRDLQWATIWGLLAMQSYREHILKDLHE